MFTLISIGINVLFLFAVFVLLLSDVMRCFAWRRAAHLCCILWYNVYYGFRRHYSTLHAQLNDELCDNDNKTWPSLTWKSNDLTTYNACEIAMCASCDAVISSLDSPAATSDDECDRRLDSISHIGLRAVRFVWFRCESAHHCDKCFSAVFWPHHNLI